MVGLRTLLNWGSLHVGRKSTKGQGTKERCGNGKQPLGKEYGRGQLSILSANIFAEGIIEGARKHTTEDANYPKDKEGECSGDQDRFTTLKGKCDMPKVDEGGNKEKTEKRRFPHDAIGGNSCVFEHLKVDRDKFHVLKL